MAFNKNEHNKFNRKEDCNLIHVVYGYCDGINSFKLITLLNSLGYNPKKKLPFSYLGSFFFSFKQIIMYWAVIINGKLCIIVVAVILLDSTQILQILQYN